MKYLFCILLALMIFLYIEWSQAELTKEYRMAEYIKKAMKILAWLEALILTLLGIKTVFFLFLLIKKF